MSRVVSVTSEAVERVHNDCLEMSLTAILDKPLEVVPLISLAGHCSIDILTNNRNAVLLGKGSTLA